MCELICVNAPPTSLGLQILEFDEFEEECSKPQFCTFFHWSVANPNFLSRSPSIILQPEGHTKTKPFWKNFETRPQPDPITIRIWTPIQQTRTTKASLKNSKTPISSPLLSSPCRLQSCLPTKSPSQKRSVMLSRLALIGA